MWFNKTEIYNMKETFKPIHNTMDMSPISQTIENIKSHGTIWNEYYIYFLSKQEHINYQVIKDIAELADAMLAEYKGRNFE